MRLAIRSASAILLLLLTAAAAPSQQVAGRTAHAARNVVTYDELAATQHPNLFEFVRAKRPLWLRARGTPAAGAVEVMVYMDGQRIGGVDELRAITTAIVAELRYLDGREATTRWGASHANGAILVTTGPARGAHT